MVNPKDKLKGNHRLGMIYKTLERMGDDKVQAIKDDSKRFFKALENEEKV